MTTPPKKTISRRKPGEKSVRYFDENTQAAIVRYQQEPDLLARNRIYVEEILPAFDMLVQNLINVYSFRVLYESKDDLKNECLEFLYGVVGKFDASKGFRAFAYFNIVAKHWLVIKSKQNAKVLQSYVSVDNREGLSKHDLSLIDSYNLIPSVEDILTADEIPKNLKKLVANLKGRVKSENELAVLQAMEVLIAQIEEIDLLSKRAVMLYIREITGLSSKQLSIVLSSLKKQYKLIKEEMNS